MFFSRAVWFFKFTGKYSLPQVAKKQPMQNIAASCLKDAGLTLSGHRSNRPKNLLLLTNFPFMHKIVRNISF